MKVYIVVGHNRLFDNVSARAAYSTREAAERYDPWFDDRHVIVELEVDANVEREKARGPA